MIIIKSMLKYFLLFSRMVTKQAKTDCHNNFLCFTLITLCLFGMILAQTFQYSRGWTNGKKRSSFGSFLLQDAGEGQELYGICQIQRLKEIFENRQLNRVIFLFFLVLYDKRNNHK